MGMNTNTNMKSRTYTAKLECKEGNKRHTKNNPAFMELNICNADGEIVTRCVVKFDGKKWVKTHDDGKFHKQDFSEYMSEECTNDVLNQLWTLGEEKPLEFVANNLCSVEVTYYNDERIEYVETWEDATEAYIEILGVEEHTDEKAIEIINAFVKKFVKENKGAMTEYRMPLREEEYEEGLYSYSYTIWKKGKEK